MKNDNCKGCWAAKHTICHDADDPGRCREYWFGQKLLMGCEGPAGEHCVFDAAPGKYQPGYCMHRCKDMDGNTCKSARYEGGGA